MICAMRFVLAALLLASPALASETREESMDFGGRPRWWLVHEPETGKKPRPLVLVLHGGGGDPFNAERMSAMSALADREGFLAVYPAGTGRFFGRRFLTWNAGSCCGYALKSGADDTGFLSALVGRLVKEGRADQKRVYVTGLSNGGMMSHRLACERADLVAAAAPVAGTIGIPNCKSSRPVPILIIHGKADEHVPYAGGRAPARFSERDRVDRSVEEVASIWRKAGSEVKLLIHEGGHIWPGGTPGLRFGNVDPVLPEPKASEEIWAFFKARPKR